MAHQHTILDPARRFMAARQNDSTRPMPTTDTWLSAYAEDPETQSIIARLKSEVPTQWSKVTLATIDSSF